MKADNDDILEMLDVLELPVAVDTFRSLQKSPQLGDYNAIQFLRELLTPQYLETLNNKYDTNIRLSAVIDKSAQAGNLKTGNGRIYNDTTVEQILTFNFAEERMNVGVYGVTGVGKSYFLSACCVEACRLNFRSRFIDYCDLLDELIILNRQEDLKKYRKRLSYYARIQLLFIDDFAISRYPEEGMNILYHLVKMRADLGTSTLYSSQYAPDEWGSTSAMIPKVMANLTAFAVVLQQALLF